MPYRLSFASLSALGTWHTGQTLEKEKTTQLKTKILLRPQQFVTTQTDKKNHFK